MEQHFKVRIIDKIAMFFVGAINNTPFVIGVASAKRIVVNYGKDSYLGLVVWSNTFSGLFARFLNNWLTQINLNYDIRFALNCVFMIFGLLGCAFSKNFWFTLVCVFFIGFSSNFGESAILCYITGKRKQVLLKAWSSGTGMAGILGASYSVLMDLVSVSYFYSFIGISPIIILYIGFYLIVRTSPEEDPEVFNYTNTEQSIPKDDKVDQPLISDTTTEEPEHISMCNSKYLKPVWWYIFNCSAVYFLEYVIQTGFADCSLTHDEYQKRKYIFSLLNLMYQIGVFVSRSSLSFFKFPHVGVLTLCQMGFFILWLVQSFYHFMPFGVLVPAMILVGLFGGCSYVNVFHLIMNVPCLKAKEKEMSTSWNAFFISFGIVWASLFTFLAQQTFLKDLSAK